MIMRRKDNKGHYVDSVTNMITLKISCLKGNLYDEICFDVYIYLTGEHHGKSSECLFTRPSRLGAEIQITAKGCYLNLTSDQLMC